MGLRLDPRRGIVSQLVMKLAVGSSPLRLGRADQAASVGMLTREHRPAARRFAGSCSGAAG